MADSESELLSVPVGFPCRRRRAEGEFSLDTLVNWAINFHRFLYWSNWFVRRRDVAQGESACLTRKRSAVRNRPSLPSKRRKAEAPEERPPGPSPFQRALGNTWETAEGFAIVLSAY